MARINWDARGERFFELGVDRGVLYVPSEVGVAWTGLVSIDEAPTGAEERPYYIDGVKYLNLRSSEEYAATIEAFGAPAEFNVCDGNVSVHTGLIATQQPRLSFSLSYRTLLGNDLDGVDHGYKIHLVYNALAAPATRDNSTITNASQPSKFTWAITTLPPAVTGYKRTAHFVIDSRLTDPDVLLEVEDILYGTDDLAAAIPTPDELIAIFAP